MGRRGPTVHHQHRSVKSGLRATSHLLFWHLLWEPERAKRA